MNPLALAADAQNLAGFQRGQWYPGDAAGWKALADQHARLAVYCLSQFHRQVPASQVRKLTPCEAAEHLDAVVQSLSPEPVVPLAVRVLPWPSLAVFLLAKAQQLLVRPEIPDTRTTSP